VSSEDALDSPSNHGEGVALWKLIEDIYQLSSQTSKSEKI